MKNLICFLLLSLMIPTLVIGQDDPNSIDAQFANKTNMTDKQMSDAKTFVHQGIKDEKIKEGCAKLNNCSDTEEGFPLEMLISKGYAMLGMFTGDGMVPKLTNKPKDAPVGKEGSANLPGADEAAKNNAGSTTNTASNQTTNGAPGAEGKKEKDERNDYCLMAAMAWETVGGMIQSSMQNKAQQESSGITDTQLASLVNLKKTHEARAKTASWQRNVYAGVSACYVAQAFTGAQLDWKFWLKAGGAATLTYLYQKKVDKHKDAAKKVQLVIDSLPKAGDCNPYTGTKCFCAEKTSKDIYAAQYQEVCVLNNGNFETPKVAMGCGTVVDKKISFDKECKCKATNTCLKTQIPSLAGNFGLGTNAMNEAQKNFDLLASGDFDQGKFDAASLSAKTLAAKFNPKVDTSKFPKPALTTDQKKLADELGKYVPGPVANIAAAANNSGFKSGISDSSGSAAISKLTPEIKQKLAESIKMNYSKSGGGNNFDGGEEEAFAFPTMGSKAEESQGGTEVISFADQAVSKADVSNAPDTPIFDIISNRYRRSAWNKLDTQGK